MSQFEAAWGNVARGKLPAHVLLVTVLAFAALAKAADVTSAPENSRLEATLRQWPQWRGPLGTGVAPAGEPPTEWNESSGKGIRWKVELPGRGHSTPAVWDDRVYLTAAAPFGEAVGPFESKAPGAHDNAAVTHRQRFIVMSLDRKDGKIVWQQVVREALPDEAGHRTASLASASPVTDGEMVIASFGSYGLYAFLRDGSLVWKRDLGRYQSLHGHGEGSSPVLRGDLLIVNWDHEGQSFLAALDRRTGAERWKTLRNEITSWATPIVVDHAGKTQVIVSGTNRVRGYDLATGEVIWECGGLSANVVASPVAADGWVFAGSSYDRRALLAIQLDGARGDITGSDRVGWSRFRGTPYVPSPLLSGDALYFLTHYQGIISRVDAKSGKDAPGAVRLDGIEDVYASPVAAAGRVYVTDLDGTTVVLRDSDTPVILARNQLDDVFSASAAIAGRELFLRGARKLYCLASD